MRISKIVSRKSKTQTVLGALVLAIGLALIVPMLGSTADASVADGQYCMKATFGAEKFKGKAGSCTYAPPPLPVPQLAAGASLCAVIQSFPGAPSKVVVRWSANGSVPSTSTVESGRVVSGKVQPLPTGNTAATTGSPSSYTTTYSGVSAADLTQGVGMALRLKDGSRASTWVSVYAKASALGSNASCTVGPVIAS